MLSYNLPLTVVMGLVAVYWLLSVLGAVDVDTFDIDLEAEADLDLEVEGEVPEAGGGHALAGVLRFVNAQDVPIMIVLSLLALFMWLLAIASNYYLNPGEREWLALGLLAGNFIVSVLLVKAVTQPLRPFLRALKNDQEHQEPLVGMSGVVKSRVIDAKYGQVEVARTNGAPALLNARMATGSEPLVRGDEILVIDHDAEKDRYVVKSSKLLAVEQRKTLAEEETTAAEDSNTLEE